jgi:hypothetical protein
MNAPITLTLYDEKDEPIKEFKRSTVPWGVMKKAMSLMGSMNELSDDKPEAEKTKWEKFKAWFKFSKTEDPNVASLRMLEEFLVEFFGNGLKVDDLKKADTLELVSVLQSIISRASASMSSLPANPRKPFKRTRK